MIALGHTATGVIIGVAAYEILGPGGLASGLLITGTVSMAAHYFADFLPHGHYFLPKYFKKYLMLVIVFDVLLPILLFLGAIYLKNGLGEKFLYILFSIGGSQLPDVLDGLISINKIKANYLMRAENHFHQRLHWHGQGPKTLLLGFRDIWQVLVILVALLLLIL